MSLQLKTFPEDLKEQLKIAALQARVPLHEFVTRLLREALEKERMK
jgi:predicted HicB family RNase H-like nuclease